MSHAETPKPSASDEFSSEAPDQALVGEGILVEAEANAEFTAVPEAGSPIASDGFEEALEGNGEETLPNETEGEESDNPKERLILLLRHGIAEEQSDDKPDAERELTKKGALRMKEIGRGLAQIYPGLEAILTSPLVRALQTGVFLGKGYGGKILVQMTEALELGRGTMAFKDLLTANTLRRVIFVGHEPDLSQILGDLCGLDTGAMELKKGGCYAIRIKPSGEMRLEWMLPPRALRRINQ